MSGTLSLEDTPEVTGEANTSQIETVSGNLMRHEAGGAVKCSGQYLLLFIFEGLQILHGAELLQNGK